MTKKILISILLCSYSLNLSAGEICSNSILLELHQCLKSKFSVTTSLSYKQARKAMFSSIDNQDGSVELVYSGKRFSTTGIPNHELVNTEHTWPQSKFSNKKLKSDLHHLFPTYSRINSTRGSHPFADIKDKLTKRWLDSNDKGIQEIPPESVRDNYSEFIHGKFEPREEHKGAVARAMFYVYGVYGEQRIDKRWFEPQIETLLKWHKQYPVTVEELDRSKAISSYQGNNNPFVLDPTLAYRIVGKEIANE